MRSDRRNADEWTTIVRMRRLPTRVRILLVVCSLACLGVFAGDAFATHPVMVTWINDSSRNFTYNHSTVFHSHTTHKTYYGTHANGTIRSICLKTDPATGQKTTLQVDLDWTTDNPSVGWPTMYFTQMETHGLEVGHTRVKNYIGRGMYIHIKREADIWVKPPHHANHEWYKHFVAHVRPHPDC